MSEQRDMIERHDGLSALLKKWNEEFDGTPDPNFERDLAELESAPVSFDEALDKAVEACMLSDQ